MSSSILARSSLRAFTRSARLSATRANSSLAPPVSKIADAVASPNEAALAQQAPNAPAPWSTSQAPRPTGHSGPRFEQTIVELQPNPLSAQAMIAEEPVRLVHGRKAACDGGGGPLGHPKIFINLDKPGPQPCTYCGIRFEQLPHHAH